MELRENQSSDVCVCAASATGPSKKHILWLAGLRVWLVSGRIDIELLRFGRQARRQWQWQAGRQAGGRAGRQASARVRKATHNAAGSKCRPSERTTQSYFAAMADRFLAAITQMLNATCHTWKRVRRTRRFPPVIATLCVFDTMAGQLLADGMVTVSATFRTWRRV